LRRAREERRDAARHRARLLLRLLPARREARLFDRARRVSDRRDHGGSEKSRAYRASDCAGARHVLGDLLRHYRLAAQSDRARRLRLADRRHHAGGRARQDRIVRTRHVPRVQGRPHVDARRHERRADRRVLVHHRVARVVAESHEQLSLSDRGRRVGAHHALHAVSDPRRRSHHHAARARHARAAHPHLRPVFAVAREPHARVWWPDALFDDQAHRHSDRGESRVGRGDFSRRVVFGAVHIGLSCALVGDGQCAARGDLGRGAAGRAAVSGRGVSQARIARAAARGSQRAARESRTLHARDPLGGVRPDSDRRDVRRVSAGRGTVGRHPSAVRPDGRGAAIRGVAADGPVALVRQNPCDDANRAARNLRRTARSLTIRRANRFITVLPIM
ncbi:potassium/proton antiporter rosb, partial [Candidatus Burkholderia humilis]